MIFMSNEMVDPYFGPLCTSFLSKLLPTALWSFSLIFCIHVKQHETRKSKTFDRLSGANWQLEKPCPYVIPVQGASLHRTGLDTLIVRSVSLLLAGTSWHRNHASRGWQRSRSLLRPRLTHCSNFWPMSHQGHAVIRMNGFVEWPCVHHCHCFRRFFEQSQPSHCHCFRKISENP